MNIKLGFFLLTSLFVMSAQTLAAPQSEIDAIKKLLKVGIKASETLLLNIRVAGERKEIVTMFRRIL